MSKINTIFKLITPYYQVGYIEKIQSQQRHVFHDTLMDINKSYKNNEIMDKQVKLEQRE